MTGARAGRGLSAGNQETNDTGQSRLEQESRAERSRAEQKCLTDETAEFAV